MYIMNPICGCILSQHALEDCTIKFESDNFILLSAGYNRFRSFGCKPIRNGGSFVLVITCLSVANLDSFIIRNEGAQPALFCGAEHCIVSTHAWSYSILLAQDLTCVPVAVMMLMIVRTIHIVTMHLWLLHRSHAKKAHD